MLSVTRKELVKQKIMAEILSNKYLPGQKLAGERHLAQEFGVSRGTVREVINKLSQEGLLRSVKGSGTFVNIAKNQHEHIIKVPVAYPDKILTKHFLGKLREVAAASGDNYVLEEYRHNIPTSKWDAHRMVRQLFSEQGVGLFETTMNDLPWLVSEGICEDLTARFQMWSEANNIYPVSIDAVKLNRRIYGLPFHCTLCGLAYFQNQLDGLHIDFESSSGSIDNFIRMTEKIHASGKFRKTFWAGDARFFLMALLAGYYENLQTRFASNQDEPIEPDIGIEILSLLHRLKWKLNAYITTFYEQTPTANYSVPFSSFAKQEIPISLIQLSPVDFSRQNGMARDAIVTFKPIPWGKKGKFTLFNSLVWIINAGLNENVKEFLWKFLSEYVGPESEYEIDRRHMEENIINSRSNPFIAHCKRVPYDPRYHEQRKEFFDVAIPEIPFPSSTFDQFAFAAYRVLYCEDVDIKMEYDFYRNMQQGYSTIAQSMMHSSISAPQN